MLRDSLANQGSLTLGCPSVPHPVNRGVERCRGALGALAFPTRLVGTKVTGSALLAILDAVAGQADCRKHMQDSTPGEDPS
jgi:hypothetical protein